MAAGTTDIYFPSNPKTTARLAGMAYLVIIFCGVTADLVLRAPLKDATPEMLVNLLQSNPGPFRLSLLADIVMVSADIALALLFFVLLRAASPTLALAVLVLRLMQAAVIAASLVLLTALPGLADAGETGLAQLVFGLHATGYDIGLVFFGLNSLLMWRLLSLSGGVPAWIAYAIGSSGLVYITGSVIRILAPDMVGVFEPAYLLPLVAETSLCLWLLIKARI